MNAPDNFLRGSTGCKASGGQVLTREHRQWAEEMVGVSTSDSNQEIYLLASHVKITALHWRSH